MLDEVLPYEINGSFSGSGSDNFSANYSVSASLSSTGGWSEHGSNTQTESGGTNSSYSGSGGSSSQSSFPDGSSESYSASTSISGGGNSSFKDSETWTTGTDGWDTSSGSKTANSYANGSGSFSGSDSDTDADGDYTSYNISPISQSYVHDSSQNLTLSPSDGSMVWTGPSTDTVTATGSTSCNGESDGSDNSNVNTDTSDSYDDVNTYGSYGQLLSGDDEFDGNTTTTKHDPDEPSGSTSSSDYDGDADDGTTGFANHTPYGDDTDAPLGEHGESVLSLGVMACPGAPSLGANAPSAGAGLMESQASWLTDPENQLPGVTPGVPMGVLPSLPSFGDAPSADVSVGVGGFADAVSAAAGGGQQASTDLAGGNAADSATLPPISNPAAVDLTAGALLSGSANADAALEIGGSQSAGGMAAMTAGVNQLTDLSGGDGDGLPLAALSIAAPTPGSGVWSEQASSMTTTNDPSSGFLAGVSWSSVSHSQSPRALAVPDQAELDVQQEAPTGSSWSGSGTPGETFNAAGQITSVTNALGGVTTATYDAAERLTSVTDPPTASNKTGNTTAWTYDDQNRVTSQTTPLGTSSFAYSPNSDNLTQYTDADGRVTTYLYNSQNQITQETWYASASALTAGAPEEILSYTYDSDGDITAETDFNCAQSQTVSADYYAYNDSDQLTAVVETQAGGPAVQLVYSYNDAGGCSGVTASIGGTVDSSGNYTGGTLDYQNSYAYDANGDLTQIHQSGQTGGDAVATKEIDFTYNAAGQFETIYRYQNGHLVDETDYTYNFAGQLVSLVDQQGGNVLSSYAYSYAYSYASGSGASPTAGPATPTVWTPAGATLPFNNPSQIDLGSLDQASSAANLLASVTSVDGTATYSYDAMGEVTSASYTGTQPSESYSWDANGNPSGSNYVIGPDNEILSDGTYNYTYDADGNMVTRTQISSASSSDYETTYTWDNRNRLAAVTNQDNSGTVTQTVSYQYDVENRWIGETVTSYSGGVATSVHTTDFAYDGQQIALQFDATSTPGTPVTLTASNLSHRYVSGPAVDQVLADDQATNPQTPGNVVWTLTDNEGTIRDLAVYNAQTGTTAVVNHRTYDPFGKLLSQTNPATGTAAAVDCLFGYTGFATDANTDIEFHERRVKTSGSTDWLSQDPIDLTSGVTNLDDYCGNDPINATDPTGLVNPVQPQGSTSTPHNPRILVIGGPGTVLAIPAGSMIFVTDKSPKWDWDVRYWWGFIPHVVFTGSDASWLSSVSPMGTPIIENVDSWKGLWPALSSKNLANHSLSAIVISGHGASWAGVQASKEYLDLAHLSPLLAGLIDAKLAPDGVLIVAGCSQAASEGPEADAMLQLAALIGHAVIGNDSTVYSNMKGRGEWLKFLP